MSTKNLENKISWYYGLLFLFFCLSLFWVVILPLTFRTHDALSLTDEPHNLGKFIAGYAQSILYKFDQIGPKVVGSFANENKTVQLLLDEIGKIRDVMNIALFDMEIDRQQVSGAYISGTMINMYQGVQNVVVKFSAKNSTSDSYLLVNSHFDSSPGSSGSGDGGFMVVVMLETLRQIAKSNETFQHPIIFLFNGAKENMLQGAHGFITQHKWASKCEAFLNLAVGGGGKRDMLADIDSKHDWLMKYYRKSFKYPFATTLIEEILQSKYPIETDAQLFRNYANLPGLNLVKLLNGYTFHTKFENYDAIPISSLQSAGNNILLLVRTLSNATELADTKKCDAGSPAVFFDFLGIFLFNYSRTTAARINYAISGLSLAFIIISLWRISVLSYSPFYKIILLFILILVIQLIGLVLAFGVPIVLAVILDVTNHSMIWFTHTWLNMGLYICPSLILLSLPLMIFYSFSSYVNSKIGESYRLQIGLHAHCLILALLCIILTVAGIRSVYVIMIPILFYTISVIINHITNFHDRKYSWAILHSIFQIVPFLYSTYIVHIMLAIIIPMTAHNGTEMNSDMFIASSWCAGSILAMGFLIPLLNMFRRPKLILFLLAVFSIILIIISLTPVGFPYRSRTNVQRVNLLHVERVFNEYDGSVSGNDSGYLFDFQDRRRERPLIDKKVNLTGLRNITRDCTIYMMCGMPVFNYRWNTTSLVTTEVWLPRNNPLNISYTPPVILEFLARVINNETASIRYEFKLSGPPHMSLFMQPLERVSLTGWSFLPEGLEQLPPPYHIFFSYGNDAAPLIFNFTFQIESRDFDRPFMELSISAHFISIEYKRDVESLKFLKTFPNYSYVTDWPSSFNNYIF